MTDADELPIRASGTDIRRKAAAIICGSPALAHRRKSGALKSDQRGVRIDLAAAHLAPSNYGGPSALLMMAHERYVSTTVTASAVALAHPAGGPDPGACSRPVAAALLRISGLVRQTEGFHNILYWRATPPAVVLSDFGVAGQIEDNNTGPGAGFLPLKFPEASRLEPGPAREGDRRRADFLPRWAKAALTTPDLPAGPLWQRTVVALRWPPSTRARYRATCRWAGGTTRTC